MKVVKIHNCRVNISFTVKEFKTLCSLVRFGVEKSFNDMLSKLYLIDFENDLSDLSTADLRKHIYNLHIQDCLEDILFDDVKMYLDCENFYNKETAKKINIKE